MVTLLLAAVLWCAIGGRLGLTYAREDHRRNLSTCVGVGALAGALFGVLLGTFWRFLVSLAGAPVS